MDLVCYAYKNSKGELQAPFIDYLQKYAYCEQDLEQKKVIRAKQLWNINEHLNYLKTNNGKYHIPPYCQQYRGKNVGILKISENSGLVRIAFYTKSQEFIVVLDAIDKPKLYEKGKKLNIHKMIQKFLERVDRYKTDYDINHLSIPLKI